MIFAFKRSARRGFKQGLTRDVTRGFALVEMLVAMTLGLIVIAGMITAFAGNKRSNDVNSAMANIQENARYALNQISRDIRAAGFQGCVDVNNGSTSILAKDAPTTKLRNTATTGSIVGESAWSPAPPTGFTPPTTNPAIKGTHTLALQFGSEVKQLNAAMSAGGVHSHAGDITVKGGFSSPIKANDLMIVSDCDISNLFQVSAVTTVAEDLDAGVEAATILSHAATHNVDSNKLATGNLTKIFGATTEALNQTMVMKFSSDVYYVGKAGIKNEDGDDITSLYRQSLPYTAANPPTEMIQGVENIRVAFGVRENNGSLSYVAASHANYDPAKVESILVGLLLVSWDRISAQDDLNTYVLAGQDVPAAATSTDGTTHPQDRRFRLAFNTTIKVRNRRDETI